MPSSFLSRRFAVAAALVFGVLGMGSSAHARSDVTFSIGIQVPGAYVQPAPVYVQPPQVYYQPQPVYVQPAPVYVQPRPVFVQPPAYGVYYRSAPDWRRSQWERKRKHGRHGGRWDRRDRGDHGDRGGHRD